MNPDLRRLSSGSELSDSATLASSQPSSPPSVTTSQGVDAVAIVGLACRVAGASNSSQLWDNILEQRDLRRQMPADRFNVDAFYHPEGANKGTTNARHGYFLEQDLRDFDASFFHISGKEAAAMDPQQRLLLEVVYEALENAGIPIEDINGSQTSVYCGCFTNDYYSLTMRDLASYPKYTVTGTGNSILANRISYFYNLHGPSVTIDTACSSSIVALHMGVQSLKNGESDISIVVGSALHFLEDSFVIMTDLGMLSPDGQSRSFDADGRGYARGEGVCAVVLKRQEHAESQGDHIRALVRGSLVNHDGSKQGITLPSAAAQEALIRQTYKNAGLNPADTQYVEAHGTGTARGDPIEAQAIGAVFGQDNRLSPLYIGSVKSNIGHLEGASGLAGIIKATMALEHGEIPPNMNFHKPNPQIPFQEWKLEVPQRLIKWPSTHGPKRASVNSFGYGGTNGHVILEEYRPRSWIPPVLPCLGMNHQRPLLLPLTSHSDTAGQLLVHSMTKYLRDRPNTDISDLARSLSTRRSMHAYRTFAITSPGGQLVEPWADTVWKSLPPASMPRRLGFVFTGQGAQWWAMGRQLIEQSPLFLQRLEYCDEVLQALPDAPDWSVVTELLKSEKESRIAQETRLSQPICTALQISLVDLLASWKIRPSATVGHSSGEIAAAYAAGILSFSSSIIAAYYRGLHMSAASSTVKGAMMAANLTPAEAQQEIREYGGRVVIGAVNSPSNVTISGDADAIVDLTDRLTARSIFARVLKVTQAFHSPHMFPLAPAYEAALRSCPAFCVQPAAIRMFSSVTARVTDTQKMGPSYWASNMTGTVRFADALVGTVLDEEDRQNIDLLIEIGPHPALKGPARQVLQSLGLNIPYLASLTRQLPAYEALLHTAGELFQLGYPVDLGAVNSDQFAGEHGHPVSMPRGSVLRDMPSHAWDHQPYWAETRMVKAQRDRSHRHVLLGSLIEPSIPSHPRWRNFLRLQELPWLRDHVIDGLVIFPAAGYIAMAVEAMIVSTPDPLLVTEIQLQDIAIKAPLPLNDQEAGVEVMVELKPRHRSDTEWEFVIVSYTQDAHARSVEHCTGFIAVSHKPSSLDRVDFDEVRRDLWGSTASAVLYQHLSTLGLQYGSAFQLLSGSVETGPKSALGSLVFPARQYTSHVAEHTILHPTLLDASFHLVFAALQSVLGRPLDQPYVPTTIRTLRLSRGFLLTANPLEQQEFLVSATVRQPGPQATVHDLVVMGQGGSKERNLQIKGLKCVSLGARNQIKDRRSLFFRTLWRPAFNMLRDENTSFRTLPQLVDLFLHQHPNTRIAHFTDDLAQAKDVIALLGGGSERRRCQSITPVFPPDLCYSDELKKLHNSHLIDIREPDPESVDLVIISSPHDVSRSVHYAREGGYIITEKCIESVGLTPLFTSQGYKVWRKRKEHTGIERRPLTIIMAPCPSERTQGLARAIRSHYGAMEVSFVMLGGAFETSSFHHDIVVLCSLDEDRLLEDSQNYKAIQSLMTGPTSRRIVWVLQGGTIAPTKPEHAIIIGLARAARSENDLLRLLTVDITPDTGAEAILRLLDVDMVPGEDEIAERDDIFLIPRVYADDDLNSKLYNGVNSQPRLQQLDFDQPRRLVVGETGRVNTLMFVDDEDLLDHPIGTEELEIEVQTPSLSSGDAALTLGTGNEDDASLGGAFAGVVCRTGAGVDTFNTGDRVVAFRPGHSPHRTIMRSPVHLCQKVPDTLLLSDAALVALGGVPAYHAVVTLAHLQPHQTILIHISSRPIKQMAVQLARRLHARIIVTVQSREEQELLQESFGMDSSHILFSVSEEQLIQQVMQLTNGKGVNVVVNQSLSAGIERCLAAFGVWVSLNSRATMPVKSNTTFSAVDMMAICQDQADIAPDLLESCLALVQAGEVHPPIAIPHILYRDLIGGFEMVQQHRHDTVILTADRENDLIPVRPPSYRRQPLLHPDKQYLLVGGLGGIGRMLAEWLVRRGAQDLVFFSRSGMDRPEAQSTVVLLQQRGVQVSVVQGDVASYSDVKRCIEALPRLAGIFHAAMVLRDGPLDTMTHEQWQQCLQPKVQGTMNLHEATKSLALDFFACFSSVSAIIGTRGQANYCAANAFMDALMAYRRLQGLPGSTMNCGMITGVGVVAESHNLQKDMERLGYDAVNEYELLCQVEEAVCNANAPETISGLNLARHDLYWATKPLLRNLYANHDWDVLSKGDEEEVSLVRVLDDTIDATAKTSILLHAFMTAISKMLVIPLEQIQAAKPLSSYGLDSLVAMEIRKWFSSTIGVDLPLFEILSSPSIAHLVDRAITLMPSIAQTGSTHARPEEPLHESHTPEESIGKADMSKPIPMTPYQARMWLAHRSATSESSLNLAVVCRLRGSPDPFTIQQAFRQMKQRNAVLRTGYRERDGFYEQFVTGDSSVDLDIRDCRGLVDPEASLTEIIVHCKSTPVDIASGKVMQLILVHLTEREHALICVVHHIAIDGGSTQPMLRQWTQLYNSLRNQRVSADISAHLVSYSDFAVWHDTRIRRTLETDLVFWKECLAGIPSAHKLLPFARCERPLIRDTTRAYVHGGLIPPTLVKRMKRICRQNQVTPVDFLISAFRAFIFRHTQDDDITFLLVNGTRPHPAVEELVGCFVDMTPLRCQDPNCNDLTFDQLLTVTHQRSLEALSHSDVPFLEIVRALGLPPTRAHNPVGQIYVNYYMHGPTPVYELSDCTISEVQVHDIPSASELSLAAMDDPQDGLRMSLQYATSLYQADDMQRFLDGLCHFICSAIRDHRQLIEEISMNEEVGSEVSVLSSNEKSGLHNLLGVTAPSPVVTLPGKLDTFPVFQKRTVPSWVWITVNSLLCVFIFSTFVFLYTSVAYLLVLAICFLFLRLIAMPNDVISPL